MPKRRTPGRKRPDDRHPPAADERAVSHRREAGGADAALLALLDDPGAPGVQPLVARRIRVLQATHGNQYVQRLAKRTARQRAAAVQAKLTVGPAGEESSVLVQRRPFAGVGGLFAKIGKAITNGAKAVYGAATTGAKAVANNVTDAAAAIYHGAKTAPGAVAGALTTFGDALRETAQAVGAAALAQGRKLKLAAEAVGTALINATVKVGTAALEKAKAVKDTAVRAVIQAVNKLKGAGKKYVYTGEFMDLNASQYRVTGPAKGPWKVEKVVRKVDENGKPVYYAVGEVTNVGSGPKRPDIKKYESPQLLEDWAPTVTHINGMAVKPMEGIGSAVKLHNKLREALETSGDAAVETDVLYTYSATRGYVTDALECMKGKLYISDDVTKAQEQIMLDAVDTKTRTTVSAHSRGTIKTDNAVLNVHKQLRLRPDIYGKAYNSPQAIAAGEKAVQKVGTIGGTLLAPSFVGKIARKEFANQAAFREASRLMDAYVQLIYAGNAVQFPSTKVQGHLVVAKGDPITIAFGKYFRWAKPAKMKMKDVPGGHGFDKNYAKTVAETIAKDLRAELELQGG